VRAALEAHASETGCTVHVATLELDDGPILAQRRVAVLAEDTKRRCTNASRPSSDACTVGGR